jgi:hypothetical protein
MKKWLLVLFVILIIAIAAVYLFIPRNISVTQSAPVTATQEGVLRYLSDTTGWKKFWPGTTGKNKDGTIFYSYKGYNFFLEKIMYNSVDLTIERNKDSIKTVLFFIPFQLDSFKLQWTVLIQSGANPFKRIQGHFTGRKIDRILGNLLQQMAATFSKPETIYGVTIKKEKVPFQHFLSTKTGFDHYPSTIEIYTMIDAAREYAAKKSAKETDPPILNIKTTENNKFEAQVAIPIDKDIPGNTVFLHKWMMKGGNIITAEVRGDNNAINKATGQVNQYIIDYRRSAIAIPFQMLITDRRKEPDSTKWVTRLYFPVV